jgi:hypothetical protein
VSGKIVGVVLLLCAAIAGGALYYLQVYGYYETVQDDGQQIALTVESGEAVPVSYTAFEAIDATSSPIRYRACFRADAVDLSGAQPMPEAIPRNAPGWFDCFDAAAIAADLAEGTATAYLGVKNIAYGVDRIVVLTEDGRGFAWHDLNDCGEKAYDGTVVGEACPERPAAP